MQELVEMIAKALVDTPDKVVVSQLEGEQTTILELKVAPEDLGKVIGKQGRTARAHGPVHQREQGDGQEREEGSPAQVRLQCSGAGPERGAGDG